MTTIKASLRQAALERRASAQKGVSLIELLVAMSILTVITTMILVSWFALQNSFAYSVHSDHAREAARDAVSRMTVAIRDAQGTESVGAISVAKSSTIEFTTSYAQTSGANVGSTPVLRGFHFVPPTSTSTGKIYSVQDQVGAYGSPGADGSLGYELINISTYGQLVVDNVVNNSTSPTTDLFQYTYFGTDGTLHAAEPSLSSANTKFIYSVQIHCLVDLNPKRAPVYMDLQTTAQPRNMRPST